MARYQLVISAWEVFVSGEYASYGAEVEVVAIELGGTVVGSIWVAKEEEGVRFRFHWLERVRIYFCESKE
jgi:hypothetical protein